MDRDNQMKASEIVCDIVSVSAEVAIMVKRGPAAVEAKAAAELQQNWWTNLTTQSPAKASKTAMKSVAVSAEVMTVKVMVVGGSATVEAEARTEIEAKVTTHINNSCTTFIAPG